MLGTQAQRAGAGAGVQDAARSSPRPHPPMLTLRSSGCPALVVARLYCHQSSGTRGSEPQLAGGFRGKWFSSPKEQGAVQSGAALTLRVVGSWPLWQRLVGFQNPCWRFREQGCSGQRQGKEGFRTVGPRRPETFTPPSTSMPSPGTKVGLGPGHVSAPRLPPGWSGAAR